MKTILVEIDVEGAPQAIKNINDLENAISKLEDELKQAEFGSEEFKKLSRELNKAQTELKNTELALESLDSEQVASEFGALTGAVGDLTGAFVLLGGEDSPIAEAGERISTAIGVSMAFKGAIEGISAGRKLLNNALATSNTLQKINNATTVAATTIMGLFSKSVKTTTFTFKALKTAIIATGVGALVIGIMEAISAISDWISGSEELESQSEKTQKAIEAQKKAFDELSDAMEHNQQKELALAKLRGASAKQLRELQLQQLKQSNQALIAEEEKTQKAIQHLKETTVFASAGVGESLKQLEEKLANDRIAIRESEQKIELKIIENQQAAQDEYAANEEKREEARNKRRIEREKAALKDSIITIETRGLKTLEIESNINDRISEIQEISLEERNRANMLYYESLDELRKKDLEEETQLMQQRLSIASDALGAINDLVQAFAKEDEESARKAFNVNKAVGIAQAIVSTAQGIIAQLAVPQDALTGANFIKAGIVAATGAAQIATISKTEFQGSQATTSPRPNLGGGIGGGTGATTQPPAFNVVGQSGFNQIATALGQGQPPIQAYVVSQDVTTAQQLDNAIIETATF
jgi:hypothetical protein